MQQYTGMNPETLPGFLLPHVMSQNGKRQKKNSCVWQPLFEHSDDAIIGKSLDGVIISWNAGAERIYGYSATEVIGQHISMLAPSHQLDDTEYILGKIRNEVPILHYETVRRNKEGKDLQVSLTVSPIKDVKGNLIGVSTIARDVTERKRAEETIRRANAYNRESH